MLPLQKKQRNVTFLKQMKHTGQTKHDSQNILGCVRLSDLVKTMIMQFFINIFKFNKKSNLRKFLSSILTLKQLFQIFYVINYFQFAKSTDNLIKLKAIISP